MNDPQSSPSTPLPATDRRGQRIQETRRSIQETAVTLFAERGYDDVTVEEIAAAAGVSHMTVFRHFPTKSALVFYGEYDQQMLEMLRAWPVTTTIEAMVITVYREAIGAWLGSGDQVTAAQMRIVNATPALQGAIWAETLKFREAALNLLLERFGDDADPFALRVLMATVTATAMMALLEWAADDGARPIGMLLDRAVGVLRDSTR
ncbi:MAG: TetR family transcriptional regulator [Thermomicrobiales bacterium]